MIGSVTSTAGTCTIHSKSSSDRQKAGCRKTNGEKADCEEQRLDHRHADNAYRHATDRRGRQRNQMGPARLAAGKTSQQTPSKIGGALAIGDEHGGNPERKNERYWPAARPPARRHEPCRRRTATPRRIWRAPPACWWRRAPRTPSVSGRPAEGRQAMAAAAGRSGFDLQARDERIHGRAKRRHHGDHRHQHHRDADQPDQQRRPAITEPGAPDGDAADTASPPGSRTRAGCR